MKLHFNKSNGIFSVRRYDRSTVAASERNSKVPFLGSTVELSPSVHILVTKGSYIAATQGQRPVLPVVVTKWPLVKLIVARIKEVINA